MTKEGRVMTKGGTAAVPRDRRKWMQRGALRYPALFGRCKLKDGGECSSVLSATRFVRGPIMTTGRSLIDDKSYLLESTFKSKLNCFLLSNELIDRVFDL